MYGHCEVPEESPQSHCPQNCRCEFRGGGPWQSCSVEKIPFIGSRAGLKSLLLFLSFSSPKVKKPQEAWDKGFSKPEAGWPRSPTVFLRNWPGESKPDKWDLFNRAGLPRLYVTYLRYILSNNHNFLVVLAPWDDLG